MAGSQVLHRLSFSFRTINITICTCCWQNEACKTPQRPILYFVYAVAIQEGYHGLEIPKFTTFSLFSEKECDKAAFTRGHW
jgi:hypothetical protein